MMIIVLSSVIPAGADTLGHLPIYADSVNLQTESLLEQASGSEKSSLADHLTDSRRFIPSISYRLRMISRLQQAAGYSDHRYEGSPVGVYQRIKFTTAKQWSGCILAEKDPGEAAWNDLTTVSLGLREKGILSGFVLGDYIIEEGEGLALWRGSGFSKGTDIAAPVIRKGGRIVPNTSSGEESYLRGIAVSVRTGMFSPLLFASRRSRSASLDHDGTIQSLYTTGYFRTEAEREKKNTVTEDVEGFSIAIESHPGCRFGMLWLRSAFNHPLHYAKDLTERNVFTTLSFFGNYSNSTIGISGEIASMNSGYGAVVDVRLSPGGSVTVVGAFRHYEPGFYSSHGSGFGDSPSNEQGLYLGAVFRPVPHLRISIWSDRYGEIKPGTGTLRDQTKEYFMETGFSPLKRGDMTFRYTLVQKKEPVTRSGPGSMSPTGWSRHIRTVVDYRTSRSVRFRWWYEYNDQWSDTGGGIVRGSAMYQDAMYVPSARFSLDFRIVLFSTNGYETAVREYERDCAGLFSMPVLYGLGSRWYLLGTWAATDHLDFTVKYSCLTRNDIRRIGTGEEQLPGNHDNRVSMQVDFHE